jgi:hypothetical protein
MQLAGGLLGIAAARGARIFEGEAVAFDATARSVGVLLKNDRQIEARSVVLATGYVMPDIIHSTIHKVSSSWAIATIPQPQKIWKGGALIWEDSTNYLYARTTRAGRIIIGGEDSEQIVEAEERDRLIPEKAEVLVQKLAALCRPQSGTSSSGDVRQHQRRPATHRSRPRCEGHLRGLRLRRQRHNLQLSRRANDRRSDRRIDLGARERFCAGPGWHFHRPLRSPSELRSSHRVMLRAA